MKEIFEAHTLKCLAGGFILGLAAYGLGGAMMSATGSPEFCGTCHSMKNETMYFAQSSHRSLECVECHLPHDNSITYLMAKAETGMVDMYHELKRDYPANMKLSDKGRTMVDKNCLRCHKTTMENVHYAVAGADGDCLKCHSRIAHGSNHLEGGIKVE